MTARINTCAEMEERKEKQDPLTICLLYDDSALLPKLIKLTITADALKFHNSTLSLLSTGGPYRWKSGRYQLYHAPGTQLV